MAIKDTSKLTQPSRLVSEYNNRDDVSGQSRLPTGYEGNNIPDDFFIPACTIEDVDKAVFKLFDSDLQLTVTQRGEQKTIPVIFATGERFALVKRLKPVRDSEGAIILPLISIRRSGMTQSKSQTGRGQDTGDMVIKKRLDSSDRRYQTIVNNLNLVNQKNVVSDKRIIDNEDPKRNVDPGFVGSRDYTSGPVQADLFPRIGSNIFEIITIPFPKFYGMTYEVTFWTQYTTHMNSLLEQTILSYQAPGNNFKITTDKGYWFVAYVDDEFADGTNFDDFTDQERIVRYTFTLSVDAYLVANQPDGKVSPFRRFVSAPSVSFEMAGASAQIRAGTEATSELGNHSTDAFMLEDTMLLDRHGNEKSFRGRKTQLVKNPFGPGYLNVLSSDSRTGESVTSVLIQEDYGDLNASSGGGSSSGQSGPSRVTLSNKADSEIPGGSSSSGGGG